MSLTHPLPDDFASARDRLHVLATHVITPARYRATGRIGLRAWEGLWGTPPFDAGGVERRVWVDGDTLVVQAGTERREAVLTTLAAAAELVLGRPAGDLAFADDLDLHDKPPLAPPDTDLSVRRSTAKAVAGWFNLAFDVLNQLRDDEASVESSEPQLWPEHFDPAIETLAAPRRGSYGFSPGDADHDEPYVYVSMWSADQLAVERGAPPWTATAFTGAELPAAAFLSHDDPEASALAWLRARRDDLAGTAAKA